MTTANRLTTSLASRLAGRLTFRATDMPATGRRISPLIHARRTLERRAMQKDASRIHQTGEIIVAIADSAAPILDGPEQDPPHRAPTIAQLYSAAKS